MTAEIIPNGADRALLPKTFVIRNSPRFCFLILAASAALAEPAPTPKPAGDRPDQVHFNAGNSLEKQQRYEEAVYEFQAAIAANPNDGRSYDNLGFCLRELRR